MYILRLFSVVRDGSTLQSGSADYTPLPVSVDEHFIA